VDATLGYYFKRSKSGPERQIPMISLRSPSDVKSKILDFIEELRSLEVGKVEIKRNKTQVDRRSVF
jgi:hypothetical protein